MNDQELRQIVRQALAKTGVVPVPGPGFVQSPVQLVPETVPFGSHVSHSMYLQLVNQSLHVGFNCRLDDFMLYLL